MDTKNLLNFAHKDLLFVTKRPDIVMASGAGMMITDTNGNEYLDCIGGWAVNCLGHSPKVIQEVLTKQAATLVNGSPQFYNDAMVTFAHYLTDNSCLDRVFFCSTGSEANEGAVKLARKHGALNKNGAYEIITMEKSFHGRTLTTMSATGKKVWESLFEPKTAGFHHVPFNNIEALKKLVSDKTCAIMLEPIQGEGGVFAADPEYLRQVRQLCDQTNTLLIFDEVQTGIGRTGKLFAYEHFDIHPDIMTLAKGLGGGFPVAAMLASEALNIFEPGDQGGTYTGQPLAMVVGHAVVKEVIEKNLPAHAEVMETYIKSELEVLATDFPIHNIRGKGLLLAFDLEGVNAQKVVEACLERGLIINASSDTTVRLIPPLIIQKEDVDLLVNRLKEALRVLV
ncbi:acetylornithine transaminase [Candidatus Marinamargulisbacteria bacterium SCGC AG-439-L15]|nr:acetylornithine transaminase [Candidatus Marinamargulisbacteria bacterium SCGC AG-439-L15]